MTEPTSERAGAGGIVRNLANEIRIDDQDV